MVLRFGLFEGDLMSAYYLEQFNCLLELQLHAARSNLCRLPPTSRGDTLRQVQQPTSHKISSSSKISWKR
jgi:hypothetical protein